MRWRTYEQTRDFVRDLGIKRGKDWTAYCQKGVGYGVVRMIDLGYTYKYVGSEEFKEHPISGVIPKTRITDEMKIKIKQLLDLGISHCAISKSLDVAKTTVGIIATGALPVPSVTF